MHRSLTGRSLMRRDPLARGFGSFRPPTLARCSVSWPSLAAPGCGHEAKIDFTSVVEAPDRRR